MGPKEIREFFLRHGYLLITAAWLITIAFLINNYWLYNASPQGVRNSLERDMQRREKAFLKLSSDTALMQGLIHRNYSEADLAKLTSLDFYIFTYSNSRLTFWNTFTIEPDSGIGHYPPGIHFDRLGNGYYEIIKVRLSDSVNALPENYALGLIPVKLEYYRESKYLKDVFFDRPALGAQYSISKEATSLPVRDAKGAVLFYLQYDRYREAPHLNWVSAILKVIAGICILLFLNLFAVFLGKRTRRWYGFAFLGAVLVLLRVLSYIFPFPFNYRDYGLFDPLIYASGPVLRSLGDLLINIMMILWMILYFRSELLEHIRIPVLQPRWRLAATAALSLSLYAIGQFFSEVLRSLVIDSKISFDVTNFFSLNQYSVIGFVVLGFIAFSFLFFSQVVNHWMDDFTNGERNRKYIILALAGFAWLLIQAGSPDMGYAAALMIWLMIYIFLLDIIEDKITRGFPAIPFILWLLLLTITSTAILVYYNNQREAENRQIIADKLSKRKDPWMEYNLEELNNKIRTDREVKDFFGRKGLTSRSQLVNHLQNAYFNSDLNKFEIRFYTYDADGNPASPRDSSTSIESLNTIINAHSEFTGKPDLYYYETSFNNYYYIGKLVITDSTNNLTTGYLFYLLHPKLLKTETIYPELLVNEEDLPQDITGYSYAVYDKLQLASNYNDYPFPVTISKEEVPVGEYAYREKNGYSQLWYRASKDRVVVVVKQSRNFIEGITLFAYMFCVFLLIASLFRLVELVVRARMRWDILKSLLKINIRKQVHGTIIFIVIFAFIILGATTISFFIYRYDKNHKDSLSKNMNAIAGDVRNDIANVREFNDVQDFFDPAFLGDLQKTIRNIGEIHGVDINIYNLGGALQASTQDLIYQKKLLSDRMDPQAFYQLNNLREVQVIHPEKVGSLTFLSGYLPLRDDKGETLAYLNIPYFASQNDLNQEISNFLIALINLNAFIFLVSGLIALFITNSITRSFSLIGEKLKKINLSQQNDEIDWRRDDEIGMLVKEYNKMVRKLEVSAAMLAKSEREGAWREMARQVAHEIKNPLTPMKLSLQYLQKAISNNSTNVKDLSENVAKTLIEQIEHLSLIASDFSAFANITYANNEVFLLNEVLNSVISLYQTDPGYEISYRRPEQLLYVFADKTQINRLFTNLLQNAVQAVPEGRKGLIEVRAARTGENVLITIRDNGEGIPDWVKPKIFMPNFTTKSSGTGLGLAMCRNIAEQAKGRIWFDTRPGTGTAFYVELPLVEGG